MSNTDDLSSSSVDFVSRLPPEVVLYIIRNLEADEAVNCLRVCRRWYSIISGLEPFWRQACLRFGLSEKLIGRLLPRYVSAKELFMAAKRHRSLLCDTPSHLKTLTDGFPYNIHCVYPYVGGEDMVSVLYRDFRPREIRVEKLLQSSVQLTHLITLNAHSTAERRIVWSYLFDDYLYCAAASGVWSVYCISLSSSLPLLEWKSEHLHDPDQRIGCCPTCHMVCVCKPVYSRSESPHYWDVRIISVDEEAQVASRFVELSRGAGAKCQNTNLNIMKFRLVATSGEVTARQSTFAEKKVDLLSCTSERDARGRCRSHKLLLQWANVISSHHIDINGRQTLTSSSPECKYIVPCDPTHLELAIVRNHRLNSEFQFSADRKILGAIFQSHLIVWNVDTVAEVSVAEIVLDSYSHERMKLMAVGHVYSVVVLETSNVVLVVANSTGEVVLKCADFAVKHYSMMSPFIDFLTVVRTDWLSDITRPCTRERPAVVFWNKTNRSVEGLYFGKDHNPEVVDTPPPSGKRKRQWLPWRWSSTAL